MCHVEVRLAERDPAHCVGEQEDKIKECQRWGYAANVKDVGDNGEGIEDILEDLRAIHGIYVAYSKLGCIQ